MVPPPVVVERSCGVGESLSEFLVVLRGATLVGDPGWVPGDTGAITGGGGGGGGGGATRGWGAIAPPPGDIGPWANTSSEDSAMLATETANRAVAMARRPQAVERPDLVCNATPLQRVCSRLNYFNHFLLDPSTKRLLHGG